MLTIVSIDNISARAFGLVPPKFGVDLLMRNPHDTFDLCTSKICDAALLPAACFPALSETYETIGAFGIACRGTVDSVRLFSNHTMRSLLSHQHPIYITPESETSRRLFRLLCRMEFEASPVLVDDAERAEAHLLIGDRAIREQMNGNGLAESIDLCEWWYRQTKQPFVFARWVIRRDLSAESKAVILDWLEQNTLCSETGQGRVTMARSGLSDITDDRHACRYYQRVHARLNTEDLAGFNTFLSVQENEFVCPQTV